MLGENFGNQVKLTTIDSKFYNKNMGNYILKYFRNQTTVNFDKIKGLDLIKRLCVMDFRNFADLVTK